METHTPEERQGAVHMRRLWFRKNAARGVIVRYPPGASNAGTEESPQMRDNQEIAREILDYCEPNSTFVIENTAPLDPPVIDGAVTPPDDDPDADDSDDDDDDCTPLFVGE